MNYQDFLDSKSLKVSRVGFEPKSIPDYLFPFQQAVFSYCLKLGKSMMALDTGLGKTRTSLAWCDAISEKTGRRVLILTPLTVAYQFELEGQKLGVPCEYVRSQDAANKSQSQICITNYEMLKHFDASKFAGVYLDESDILANYTGVTKRAIVDAFRQTPYKLCGSATPSPNDILELLNHSEFLDVMDSGRAIQRFFTNNAMEAGGYRLKGYADNPSLSDGFWQWVAQWGVCLSKPSDIGFSDEGYELPGLNIQYHTVAVDHSETMEETGMCVRTGKLSATQLHKEMRLTAIPRAEKVAELVADIDSMTPYVSWCNTDYDADALKEVLPNTFHEIAGWMKPEEKEYRLKAFQSGDIKHLLTKPSICGYGLNWQHCKNTSFVGLSHSFKLMYQGLRRFYRFGQTEIVNAHIVSAETELSVRDNVMQKQSEHSAMQIKMNLAMKYAVLNRSATQSFADYNPTQKMKLPHWLKSVA